MMHQPPVECGTPICCDADGLIDFARDHFQHFRCLPMEYEAADGTIYSYESILKTLDEKSAWPLVTKEQGLP